MYESTDNGFTLIEMLIAFTVIGILATILTVNLLRAHKLAQDAALQAYVHQCAEYIELELTDPDITMSDLKGPCKNLSSLENMPKSIASTNIIDNQDGSYNIESLSKTGSTLVISGGEFIFSKGW